MSLTFADTSTTVPPEKEAHTIITVRRSKKPTKQSAADEELEEPLVDHTAPLSKHSKKTIRLQKRHEKKSCRKVTSQIKTFLDLPPELLFSVLEHLRPSDLFGLLRLNRFAQEFVSSNETSLVHNIVRHRYWVLKKCFPSPIPLPNVSRSAYPALFSSEWQKRIKIHRNPYQHIKQFDPVTCCSCMSCVLAWNNLNIILDLSHWQPNFENREPIPIIPRGRSPEWNQKLLESHAEIVLRAMRSPLVHARILQKHLDTTTRTIIRTSKWRKKGETVPRPRLYQLTDAEVEAETDQFLERSGPPFYGALYMRDNYYNIEVYLPNRKWSKEEQIWQYYSAWPTPHDNDLKWIVARFTPGTFSGEKMDAWLASFTARLAT